MSVALPEQIIVFHLDGELYAIDVSNVQEILPTEPCRSLPDSADFVQGLMTFRGQIIPLLNLGILHEQLFQVLAIETRRQLLMPLALFAMDAEDKHHHNQQDYLHQDHT